MSLKLFGHVVPMNARLNRTKIAAAFAGVKVDVLAADDLKADATAFELNCHPLGATPVMQTEQGYLFESMAILRHVARLGKAAGLYGATDFEASQCDQWCDFVASELDPCGFGLMLHGAGWVPLSAEGANEAGCNVQKALEALDKWLEIRTYLVGERITIADIAVFSTVDVVLRATSAAADAYKCKNVIRHYMTVLHQPKTQEALKAVGHDALIPAKPKEEKAPAPKKEEKPKKAEKPAAAEEEDEMPAEEKKKPNPLDALPPSKFVLDAFKREYSNTDTRKVAAPYFFDNFDAEGFTCFWCNYKYNEDNKMTFMTANLVRGWFQRMDHVRKYAFGCALIVGEDSKHDITAFWVFRGKGMPEIVSDVDDSELFDWTEITDINAEREKITDYLCWDGATFAAKPVLEGRAFK